MNACVCELFVSCIHHATDGLDGLGDRRLRLGQSCATSGQILSVTNSLFMSIYIHEMHMYVDGQWHMYNREVVGYPVHQCQNPCPVLVVPEEQPRARPRWRSSYYLGLDDICHHNPLIC